MLGNFGKGTSCFGRPKAGHRSIVVLRKFIFFAIWGMRCTAEYTDTAGHAITNLLMGSGRDILVVRVVQVEC